MSFPLEGSAVLTKSFEKNVRALFQGPKLVQKKLELASVRIQNEAKRNLQRVSPGDKEFRYNPPRGKREVTVSRDGDSPNTDSGTAIKSIVRELAKGIIFVGTRLQYLAGLEFDADKIKRKARPWLGPAFKTFRKKTGSKFWIIKLPVKQSKRP